jgi:hypothetical protein
MLITDSTDETGFAGRVGQSLLHLRWSLQRAAADVQAAGSEAAALRARSDQAHAAVETRRREIDQARARMKASMDAGEAAAAGERRAERNVERLQHRAAHAEQYAFAALVVAWGAIEEAHAAILDAAAARADADGIRRGGLAKG